MRVFSNGEPAYRKLYLRTKDHPTARRRARAIEHLDDIEEARKVIRYLAGSRSPEVERRRIAEVARLAAMFRSRGLLRLIGRRPAEARMSYLVHCSGDDDGWVATVCFAPSGRRAKRTPATR